MDPTISECYASARRFVNRSSVKRSDLKHLDTSTYFAEAHLKYGRHIGALRGGSDHGGGSQGTIRGCLTPVVSDTACPRLCPVLSRGPERA